MACGNNKVSRTGLHSQPTMLSHPVLARVDQSVRQRAFEAAKAADRRMDHAKQSLQAAMSRADVRTALDSALRALDAARRAGGDKLARNRVRDLERQIQQMQREADDKETEIAGRDVQRIAMTEMRRDMMFRDTMGRQSLGVSMLRIRPMTGTATDSGPERATAGSAQGHLTTASPLSGQNAPAQPSNQARAASSDSTAGPAQAERLAASAHTKTLGELVEDKKVAQRVLSAAINAQRPADELSRLKASVKTIQQAEAKAAAKAKAEAKAEEEARAASSAPAPASTLDQVLAARAVELDINELLKTALSNDRIPADLKAELPTAMAKVQAVSSHAPGISVETIAGVEVGRSSRHGATVWASTVKGGGQVHGYAYEIIAASRFIDGKKTPGNGGQPVQVVQGSDELIFGQKLPAADGRDTVEADILIVKEGGHKIGIDAKNYSRPLPAPKKFREQLDGIKESIRQGEVHEFHFAVRGRISDTAKEAIQQADIELRAEMRNAGEKANPAVSDMQAALGVDLSQPVICWHEQLG